MAGFLSRRAHGVVNQRLINQIVYTPNTVVQPKSLEHGWEYLYFASELARYLAELKPEADEFRAIGHRTSVAKYGRHFHDLTEALNTIGITVGLTEYLCSPEHLALGFGDTATASNPVKIARIAGEFAGVYRNLVRIGHDLATTHYGAYTELANEVSDTVLAPLREIEAFSKELTEKIPVAVAQVRAGQPMSEPLRIHLVITMDDGVAHRLMDEVNRLKKNPPPQR
jgi:hypothetical protein